MSDAVSEETQLKGYEICKEFLGGTWATLTQDDFVIKRIRWEILAHDRCIIFLLTIKYFNHK